MKTVAELIAYLDTHTHYVYVFHYGNTEVVKITKTGDGYHIRGRPWDQCFTVDPDITPEAQGITLIDNGFRVDGRPHVHPYTIRFIEDHVRITMTPEDDDESDTAQNPDLRPNVYSRLLVLKNCLEASEETISDAVDRFDVASPENIESVAGDHFEDMDNKLSAMRRAFLALCHQLQIPPEEL